ncbi:hypothetical protein Vspart_03322 [Vibrio spartinae]|uniref:Uncharacterized protein n=1 Tax=Vibrio spartinae TaxID=1918945 RepID=A0ABX6R333_9VIBR|nr:hypothetical protein Vspart_03322 [Vibrio spartinae]
MHLFIKFNTLDAYYFIILCLHTYLALLGAATSYYAIELKSIIGTYDSKKCIKAGTIKKASLR